MKKVVFWSMIALLVLFAGCAQVQVYTASPTMATVSNDYFLAEFEPQMADGKPYFNAFRLVVQNKTDKELILDWSKSNYLYQGKKNGLFGWKGMTFEELKAQKAQPDVLIRAGDTLSEVVFPLNLVGWDIYAKQNVPRKTTEDAFHLGVLPKGQNGILLMLRQGGKTISERLTVNIRMEVMNKQP